MKRVWAVLLGMGMVFLTAVPVKADGPVLELIVRGRGVQSGGAWANPANVLAGDDFFIWIVIKNDTAGTVANNVEVKIDLPSGEAGVLPIEVHTKADNAAEVSQEMPVNFRNVASEISYASGNAVLTNEGINSGERVPVVPDSDAGNMTTQYVNVGNITGGDYSYTQVFAKMMIAPRSTPGPTATPTPVLGTGGAVATASAVAVTTPQTGADEFLWQTWAWVGVGIGGYSIRKWALRKLA